MQRIVSPIVLATLNAKYIHASLGLRYLLANMDVHGGPGLRAQTQLREFVIQQRPRWLRHYLRWLLFLFQEYCLMCFARLQAWTPGLQRPAVQ